MNIKTHICVSYLDKLWLRIVTGENSIKLNSTETKSRGTECSQNNLKFSVE